MFTFTSEFFLGVLIGFVLGLLVNWLICNSQLCRSDALFKTGKSKKTTADNKTVNKQNLLARPWNIVRDDENKNKDIDDSDNIINNNDSKEEWNLNLH